MVKQLIALNKWQKNANSSLNYDEDGGFYYIIIKETIGMIQITESSMNRMFPVTDK